MYVCTIMYMPLHAIHGFVVNLWISMDNTQEKDRQRASNCCFPQSSHLLLYINIKYQHIPVPSVVRLATRSSIRAMNPGNMDSPIWMVSCYSSQEKIQSDHSKLMQIDELITDRG